MFCYFVGIFMLVVVVIDVLNWVGRFWSGGVFWGVVLVLGDRIDVKSVYCVCMVGLGVVELLF